MRGLIISGARIDDYNFLSELVADHDYIVCADSGLDHLMKTNLVPNIVIGDLDSISKDGLDFIGKKDVEILEYPRRKNKTDTELSIDYMIGKGVREITLTGVIGSRLDHSLANILFLRNISNRRINARIINEKNIIQYTRENILIKRKKDYYVSVIPLSPGGIILSLRGFSYPVENANIKFASSLGVSNKIVYSYGKIIIHSGEGLIVESKD